MAWEVPDYGSGGHSRVFTKVWSPEGPRFVPIQEVHPIVECTSCLGIFDPRCESRWVKSPGIWHQETVCPVCGNKEVVW